MAWYHMAGQEQNIVLYTDVRITRNLRHYPFTHRMDAAMAREIISRVGAVLEENGFIKRDFTDISRVEAYSLVERQYASLSFIKKSLPHALYLHEPCSMSVMLCEEDHINLQCILAGRAFGEAYTSVSRVERCLDEKFDMAFKEGVGYLSSHSGPVDSGVQLSALLCLPAMKETAQISRWSECLASEGVCLRPLRDEDGGESGCLFRLMYRPPFNRSEAEAIESMEKILTAVIEEEHSALRTVSPLTVCRRNDRIMRALGTLRHAELMRVSELLNLLADVRLGIRTGVITGVSAESLTALMMESLPAGLAMTDTHGEVDPASPLADEMARAAYVRKRFASSGEPDTVSVIA